MLNVRVNFVAWWLKCCCGSSGYDGGSFKVYRWGYVDSLRGHCLWSNRMALVEEVLEICAVVTDFFIKPGEILNIFNQNFVLRN